MSDTATKPKLDSQFLYEELTKRLNAAPADVQQRVVAHVRAKTKHSTLPTFHHNGATEQQKCELYRELIKAVLTKNYDHLAAPEEPEVAKDEEPAVEPETTAFPKPMRNITPLPSNRIPDPEPPASVQGIDPKLMPVITALQSAIQQSAVNVDKSEVESIAREIIGSQMEELRAGALETVNRYLKNIPPREVIEIRKWDGTVNEIKDACHKQLGLIVKMLAARNASGWTEFMYIWGAPGAGKTYLLKQMAQALGVKHYPYPCGPTTTEGKMLGFNNIANGSFTAGWLYEPFKNGGLVGLDEIALADAGVLGATNSIENEEFTFGNGERVARHKDFYLIAFDNTLGTGATGGFTRNKLDAATLNRFTHFKLEYDEELEKRIFGNEKWAEYVIKVRNYVAKNCQNSIYITPRATRKGAAYLAAGIPVEVVCDTVLFSLCSKEIKETIIKNVGNFAL